MLKRKCSDLEGANGDIGEKSSKLLHLPPRVGSPAHVSNSCIRYAYYLWLNVILFLCCRNWLYHVYSLCPHSFRISHIYSTHGSALTDLKNFLVWAGASLFEELSSNRFHSGIQSDVHWRLLGCLPFSSRAFLLHLIVLVSILDWAPHDITLSAHTQCYNYSQYSTVITDIALQSCI